MDQKNHLICPQCLHQNGKGATHCQLCDTPLDQPIGDKTIAPQNPPLNQHPDATIAPGLPQKPDPDVTVAPEILAQQKKANKDQMTFQLAGDLAQFEVLEILGQGGMGAVYHAKDKTLHRDVAIKMMRPVMVSKQLSADALIDEARMASKLNHPNIVTIYDVARTADSNYIVMEWVDGQPLDELIPEDGLDLLTAVSYACQIADGLNSAHQKYIIHRDIKPQNIMISSDGTLKILDFGIAGLIEQQSASQSLEQGENKQTKTMAVGTPSYMSPEQVRGLNLDQRSDVFSFGILLYQMLCGKRPFQGKDTSAIQEVICEGQIIPIKQELPDLPEALVHLLDKMLASQKDDRWQTSNELAEELHRIYGELTYQKNWWQKRHWLTKAAILIPFMVGLGWSVKDVLFPASTQQLIEQQLAEANKIAILPFENISGDPLIQLFGDGLAVNLGSDLAAIAAEQNNTWIVPSTEISRMKDQSLQAVADKYGVNLALTGSIQHMGSTRLLVMNLLDAATGQQVKTAEVNIQADELFQGHGLIRSQALELLGWQVPDGLSEKFRAQRPQLDGAYREYVQGRGYLYRYDQAENLKKALESFQNSINTDESYQEPYVGLAEVYLYYFLKTEDVLWLDKMSNTINDLKNINPQNAQVHYLSAELATKKGDYGSAIKLYQLSIEQNPSHIRSYTGLANAAKNNGDNVTSEKYYKTALVMAPNNWRVVSDLGVFYYSIGEYEQAYKLFKTLIEMSPNNHFSYKLLAASYYALGDQDNAIHYTQIANKLLPTDSGYSNLGTMLFSVKKYKESVVAFEKALEINNSRYEVWGNLADSYKLTGNELSQDRFNVAADKAKKTLVTNPNNSAVKADLSYYLANLNEKTESVFYAKQIDENNNGFENFIVALSYDQLNMVDLALNHLEIAIKKNYPIDEIENTPLLTNVRNTTRFGVILKDEK